MLSLQFIYISVENIDPNQICAVTLFQRIAKTLTENEVKILSGKWSDIFTKAFLGVNAASFSHYLVCFQEYAPSND